jgi:hypothetical protein
MAQNIPTFLLHAAAVIERDAEYTGTPFIDSVGSATYADPYLGMNRGGSNAPGIGIATAYVDPKLSDWTVLDQADAARTPQVSQHIGGSGLGDGNAETEDIRMLQGTDINDTAAFSVADTAAAADAVYDSVSGAVNKTGATVGIGDRIWGPIP